MRFLVLYIHQHLMANQIFLFFFTALLSQSNSNSFADIKHSSSKFWENSSPLTHLYMTSSASSPSIVESVQRSICSFHCSKWLYSWARTPSHCFLGFLVATARVRFVSSSEKYPLIFIPSSNRYLWFDRYSLTPCSFISSIMCSKNLFIFLLFVFFILIFLLPLYCNIFLLDTRYSVERLVCKGFVQMPLLLNL